MIMYMIRSRKTGLFSNGGMTPGFTKKGKIWKARGHLSNHLNQLMPIGVRTYRENDVEIVELDVEIRQDTIGATSFDDWMHAVEQRKEDREAAQRERIEAWRKEQRKKQYAQLKEEFDKRDD